MNNDFLRDVKATLWDVTVESEDLIDQIKNKMTSETDEEKLTEAQEKISNLEVGMNNLKVLSSELERAFKFQELRISDYRDSLINDRSAVLEDQEIDDYENEDTNEETYEEEAQLEETPAEETVVEEAPAEAVVEEPSKDEIEAVTEVEPEEKVEEAPAEAVEEEQSVAAVPNIEAIMGEISKVAEEVQAEETASEAAAVEETPAEEVAEEVPAEVVAEEPVTEETQVEETASEEAVVEETPAETVAETPVAEEATEEVVVETPVQEVQNVATEEATESVIPTVVDAPTEALASEEAVAEAQPAADVVLEIPKVGDTVEPGAPEVEAAPTNAQPLEAAPVEAATPAVTLEPEAEAVVYEQQGTMQDRGVLVNTSQAENSRASFDNQNALYTSINKPEEAVAQTEAVVEQPVAEAPVAAETPVSNQQELEQMMQQMQEAYASGDTAKAEELSNAISEKNKTLQKVAA